jgi:hypothetical protein
MFSPQQLQFKSKEHIKSNPQTQGVRFGLRACANPAHRLKKLLCLLYRAPQSLSTATVVQSTTEHRAPRLLYRASRLLHRAPQSTTIVVQSSTEHHDCCTEQPEHHVCCTEHHVCCTEHHDCCTEQPEHDCFTIYLRAPCILLRFVVSVMRDLIKRSNSLLSAHCCLMSVFW